MADKIFCGNARKINTQYGEITKISMHKDDINKIVKHMKAEKSDWINIDVLEKKEPAEGKPTHYLKINTYKPEKKDDGLPPSESKDNEPDDDLPF